METSLKLLIENKQRIQSAHPILKQKKNLRKNSSNLTSSFTFSMKEKGPIPSAQQNMTDYLGNIIEMAQNKQLLDTKEDVIKLIDIWERYVKGNMKDAYHINEIRAVINRILTKIN